MRSDSRKWGIYAGSSAILVLAALVVYAMLNASLPRREGVAPLAGAGAPVTVELDRQAVPRIRAKSLADALRAQGFMHAQERYFQMDLARRAPAGELAALFGPRALVLDRAARPFDLRQRARELAARLPAQHAEWLAAYVEGVNAGLADLGARPPEYWLAGAKPEPWSVEDTLLVLYALYTMLSNNESYERAQGVMFDVLPASVYEFLTPSTTRFDRPLTAGAEDPTGGYRALAIPPPDAFAPGMLELPTGGTPRVEPPLVGPASNQWAVGPARSAGDRALVANDPHLVLRLPNTFYRAELEWPGGAARGVTIPGLPGVLVGSSDAVAWTATVSNADQSDWVVVEVDPRDPSRYLTPDGSEPFAVTQATIAVRGGAPETLELRSTRWGPVVEHDWRGRPLALHSTWLMDGGIGIDQLELMLARDVGEALDVLARWPGPSLSWALADRSGEIAWTLNGPLPHRVGLDGSRPTSWADGTRGWTGTQTPPRLSGADAHGGVLYGANNRTLPADEAQRLSRMWMPSLRAKRVLDLLAERPAFAESDFLAMQLDTRAEAYDAVRDVVLEVAAAEDPDPLLARARKHVAAWSGRADADDVGFRLLHVYYRALLTRLLGPLLAPAARADPAFVYRWPLADEPMRRLLEERPAHLVPAEAGDWRGWLRAILHDALAALPPDGAHGALDAAWGEINTLDVGHPLAGLPLVGSWLKLPAVPQPGAFITLRVAAPAYGAQFRMAVAPGHPETGLLQMSGGQSGHFLSPNFIDQQPDWVAGTAVPFLAGPTVSGFTLRPAPSN